MSSSLSRSLHKMATVTATLPAQPAAIVDLKPDVAVERIEVAAPPETPAPPTAMSDVSDYNHGLKSKWPIATDLAGCAQPCRLEGEVADLVVLGEIPKQIEGNFYRVMCDPFVPPHPNNIPLDGDGNISVFQFHNGRVDMKTKYIETERFKLERRANKALFGLYRNPYTHHPCVRYVLRVFFFHALTRA